MKTCLLCDEPIYMYIGLCNSCESQFGSYKESDWFKELIQLQRRFINTGSKDAATLNDDLRYQKAEPSRSVGRPKVSWKTINRLLYYFDQIIALHELGLIEKTSLRSLSRLVHTNFSTIRRALIRYRKGQYY